LGFKLALDDTGAGNAGLEMLSQVPVDVVKIDRGVVVKALTDRVARGVLAGIIAIARETDTYVIAEGIEDQAMLDLVRHVGVRAGSLQDGVQGVQGYLLGRPSEAIPAPTAVETYRTLLRAA
jgi:EAL domain-containing protein (putative c-di-GMP-specific phosphodiesterase class I)